MAPASATARPILAFFFFFILQLSLLSHHVAAALSFSFDFSKASNYSPEDLLLEGDAAVNGDLVDLTCNPSHENCSGRMSYNHPVLLYDDKTGELASFTTIFTFSIHLQPRTTNKGDGLTFFLSGYPSKLPPGSSSNLLGLTTNSKTIPSGGDRFLAVEFDTFANPWDPKGYHDHMGIDLNSVTSVSTEKLPTFSLNGTMTATITLDNSTRTMEATLHFDDNPSLPDTQVKTQLPDDLNLLLPSEVSVGFSAATGVYYELHQIHSWSFNSTMASKETPIEATKEDPKQDQGISPEGPAPALAPGATNFRPEQSQVLNKKGRGSGGSMSSNDADASPLIAACTLDPNYSTHCHILIPSDAKYHNVVIVRCPCGRLKDKPVAVKKIHKDSRGEFKDFLAELRAIDGTEHVNLVRLEGWCCSLGNFLFSCCHRKIANLFLVYEYVPNGNLHQHLHEKPEVLSWEMRYKIVKGLCSALHYLHHQCRPYILHRDIKPSNILLDNEFNAKLGDFGPSRVAQNSRRTSLQPTRDVDRTRDYMDPLCKKNGQVKFRRSSDVYSFGLVLLEIAHGENDPEGVRKLHRDQPETLVKAVADKKLAGKFFTKEMERVIVLGLRCSERDEDRRPSLIGAMQFLENGGELPPATIHEEDDNQRPSLIGAMQSLGNGRELQDGPRIAPFDLA